MIKSTKQNSKFLSRRIEQEEGDDNWVKYTPTLKYDYEEIPIISSDAEEIMIESEYSHEGRLEIVGSDNSISTAYINELVPVAKYDQEFSFAGQDGFSRAVCFKSDGTKMYMVGSGADYVFQYALSTPWDVSSASYENKSFDINPPTSTVEDIVFNNDGTKFYIREAGVIYQYALSIAWDVTSASTYVTHDTLISSWECLRFNSDGSKMFLLENNRSIYQYTLSTPWDVTSASDSGISKDISSHDVVYSFCITPDGKYLFSAAASTYVYKWRLTTPWDIETLEFTFETVSFIENGIDYIHDIFVNSTSDPSFYITSYGSSKVFQFKLNVSENQAIVKSCLNEAEQHLGKTITTTETHNGIHIKPDGTKAFFVDNSGDVINQYSFGTPWDITTLSFDNISFSVAGQDDGSEDLFIKPDGTRLWISGITNDKIFQYDFGTPWDITTLSYSGISQPTSDSIPRGITFSPDGTKIFFIRNNATQLVRYDLTNAWDITTWSNAVTKTISSNPLDVLFSDDGITLMILYQTHTYVYFLEVPWEIAGSITSQGTYYFTEGAQGQSLCKHSDNSKYFMCDQDNYGVHEINFLFKDFSRIKNPSLFSSPTKILRESSDTFLKSATGTTATTFKTRNIINTNNTLYYDNSTSITDLSVTPELIPADNVSDAIFVESNTFNTAISNVAFSSDGMKLIIVYNETITQFLCLLPWSLHGLVQDFSEELTSFTSLGSIYLSPDDSMLFVSDKSTDELFRYDLSTPGDISTKSLNPNSLSTLPNPSAGAYSIQFTPDGLTLFLSDTASICKYSLSTAWDLSTAVYDLTSTTASSIVSHQTVRFNADGTRLYTLNNTTNIVYQFSLSIPWDITTISYDNNNILVQDYEAVPFSVFVTDEYMFVSGYQKKVVKFSLGTRSIYGSSIDITSLSLPSAPDAFFIENIPKLSINLSSNTDDRIIDVDLEKYTSSTTGFTAYSTYDFNFTSGENIFIKESKDVNGVPKEGTGTVTTTGYSKSLTHDITTAVQTSGIEKTITESPTTKGIYFNNDGTKMYTASATNDNIYQYDLGTPWDITTAVYNFNVKYIGNEDDTVEDLHFNNDGTKMYIVGSQNNSAVQYTLSIPWDINTACYDFSYSPTLQDTSMKAISFNNDGTKMYLGGTTNDGIYQYTLNTPWDLSSASYSGLSLSVSSEDTLMASFCFNNDGTILYMLGDTNDEIYQYYLTVPWVVASGSYENKYLSVNTGSTSLFFNSAIDKLFVSQATTVEQYELNTKYQYTFNFNALTYTPEKVTIPKTADFSIDPSSVTYTSSPIVANYNEITTQEGNNIKFAVEANGSDLELSSINIDLVKKV